VQQRGAKQVPRQAEWQGLLTFCHGIGSSGFHICCSDQVVERFGAALLDQRLQATVHICVWFNAVYLRLCEAEYKQQSLSRVVVHGFVVQANEPGPASN
jgi:hypothetical protein